MARNRLSITQMPTVLPCRRRRRLGALLLISSVLGASIVLTLSTVGVAATSKKKVKPVVYPVNIMVHPGFAGEVVEWVALKEGFFKEYGIDATLQSLATGVLPNLLAGQTDILSLAPNSAIVAASEDQKVSVLMITQQNQEANLIVQQSALVPGETAGAFPSVIKDLKGKTVCVSVAGGSNDGQIRYLADAAGLNPNTDFTIVYAGSLPNLIAGFQSGRCDAVLTTPPGSDELLTLPGATSVLDFAKRQGPVLLQQPFVTLLANQSWVAANKIRASRVVAAMQAAIRYTLNPKNTQTVDALLTQYQLNGLSPSLVSAAVGETRTSLANPARTDYTPEDLRLAIAFEQTSGALQGPVDSTGMLFKPAAVIPVFPPKAPKKKKS